MATASSASARSRRSTTPSAWASTGCRAQRWRVSPPVRRSCSTDSSSTCWRPEPASTRSRSTATGSTSVDPRTMTRRVRTFRSCETACSGREVSGVLVIGAAGLIGRAVLAEAERAGAAHAVVGRPSASMPEAHVLRLAPDAVDRLAGLLERLRPDAVVNCAGRTSGTDDELRAANVDPVAALLEALPAAAPGARLVHLGSAAEYAEVPDRATHESTPLRATTPYGAAKVAASRLVRDAADGGLDAVVARVFNP